MAAGSSESATTALNMQQPHHARDRGEALVIGQVQACSWWFRLFSVLILFVHDKLKFEKKNLNC